MRGCATAIVREGPDPTVAILLASLNDAFDAGTEQRWAFVDPIPAEIIWLLLAMSVFAIGALGCQIALRRRRHPAGGMYSYELLTGMADPPWRKPVAGWRGPSAERSVSSWCQRARVSVGSGTPEAPPIAPGAARLRSAPSRLCIRGVLRRRRGGRQRCRFSTRAARGSTCTRTS